MITEFLPHVPLVGLIGLVLTGLIVGYTRRDSRVKAVKRNEEAGPDVEALRGSLSGQTMKVRLRLIGGPPTAHITVRSGTSWCSGVSGHRDSPVGADSTIEQPATNPLEAIDFYAHLKVQPRRDSDQVLSLIVEIEADDDRPRRWWRRDRPRRWTRQVSVPVEHPPMVH